MAASAAAAKAARQLAASGAAAGKVEGKARDFFLEVCRCLPWVVKNYKLDELITVPQLRRNINDMFRQYSSITNPQVVDILVYKGREELEMVLLQHKQRHHLITKYVAHVYKDKPSGKSKFLDDFYKSN